MTITQTAARAHVSHKTVSAARNILDIPKCRPGTKPQLSLERAFADRTRATAGGHMEWAGQYDGPCPVFRFNGRRYTAYRAAFVVGHGREPVGFVKTGCEREGCVAPAHVEDRPMREKNRKAYAAIFGGAS
jgi:hypothetical protein